MATTHGFTQAEMDSLTEEELAALNDDETPGINDDVADDGAEVEPSAEEVAAASDDDVVTIEGTATDVTAEAAAAATLPAVVEEAAKPTLTVPQYELPEDYADRVANVHADQDALAQRFDDGEMSAREYEAQRRELYAQERELDNMKLKAELSTDSRASAEEDIKDTWYTKTVPSWMEAHAKSYPDGSIAYRALHDEVARIQTVRAGEGKDYVSKSILDEAHRNVQNEIRIAAGLPPLEEVKTNPTPTPKPGKQQEKRVLPPQLADIPAADGAFFEEGGKFAAISRMDGVEYEDAIARLSDSERDAYFNSNL